MTDEDKAELERLARPRTVPHREAQRSAILLGYHAGESIAGIGRRLGGSWLNLVETLFGKMARSFLRHIRVPSLDELKARMLQGIAEINAAPVLHRWKNCKALEQEYVLTI